MILDAEDTLSRFMLGDRPDAVAFDEVVGGLVRTAAANGTPVRAYGEMVAVLWGEGRIEAAIELERLWNELGEATPFALFCAYPSHPVTDPVAEHRLSQVCHLHSKVLVSAPSLDHCEITRRFPRTPMSLRHTRQLIATTLEHWDRHSLLEDALLTGGELAANAITHAESDFTVGLSRTSDGVHVEVADSSTNIPERQPGRPTALGGRGIFLVDAIGRAWGHRLLEGGKTVWVDLATSRQRDGSNGATGTRIDGASVPPSTSNTLPVTHDDASDTR